MKNGVVLACVVISASGCAVSRPRLKPDWLYPAKVQAGDDPFQDAPVVSLFRRQEIQVIPVHWVGRGPSAPATKSEGGVLITIHEVLQIRNEKGRQQAVLTAPFVGSQSNVEVFARKIDPDGTVTDIAQSEFVDETVSRDGEELGGVRRLRYPHPQVGTVLEYVIRLGLTGPLPYLPDFLLGPVPVVRYEADLSCPRYTGFGLKSYNMDAEPVVDDRSDPAWQHIRVSTRNLPAHVDEELTSSRAFDEPWWAFAVRELN